MIHDLKLMAEQASAEPATRPALANVSRRGILGGAGALVLALSLRSPARADETRTKEQKEHKEHKEHKDKQKTRNKGKSTRRSTTTDDRWSDEQRARYRSVLPAGMTLEQAAAGFPNHGQAVAALNAAREHNVSFVQLKHLMLNEGLSLGQALARLGR